MHKPVSPQPPVSFENVLVCEWPEEIPANEGNWRIVYREFVHRGTFLDAGDVRELLSRESR